MLSRATAIKERFYPKNDSISAFGDLYLSVGTTAQEAIVDDED
jgi:hypothetical protein